MKWCVENATGIAKYTSSGEWNEKVFFLEIGSRRLNICDFADEYRDYEKGREKGWILYTLLAS